MHRFVVSIACAATVMTGCKICVDDRCRDDRTFYPNEPSSYPTPSAGAPGNDKPWTAFHGEECAPVGPGEVDDRLTCAGLKAGAPWPTNGRCGDRASSTPLVAVAPNKRRWTVESGPISLDVDDVAYAVAGDHVESFAADGSLRWSSKPWEVLAEGAFPSPTIGPDGSVYAVAHSRLHAVCPDGRRHWSVNVASNHSVAMTNGLILVSGAGEHTSALFGVGLDGQRIWTASGYQIAEPTVTGSGLILLTSSDTLLAMRSGGMLAWKSGLEHPGAVVAAIGTDGAPVLLEPNDSGALTVVSRTTEGALRWSYSVTGQRVLGVSIGADGGTLLTTQDLPDGDAPAQLVSLASDGSERFRVDLGASYVSPALVDGAGTAIVVVGKPSRVLAIDTRGTIAWSFALDDAPPDAQLRAILGTQGLYVTARGYTTALAH